MREACSESAPCGTVGYRNSGCFSAAGSGGITGAFAAHPDRAAARPIAVTNATARRGETMPSVVPRAASATRHRLAGDLLRPDPVEQPSRHVGLDHRAIALCHLAVDAGVPVQPHQPLPLVVG